MPAGLVFIKWVLRQEPVKRVVETFWLEQLGGFLLRGLHIGTSTVYRTLRRLSSTGLAGAAVGGRRRALLDLVVPIAQQLSPPQAAQGGAANREAAAKGLDLNPGLALGIQILIVHGCLPRRSSQRCRCQSRCERR